MEIENNILRDLKKIWLTLTKKRKLQFIALSFAMLIMSVLELLTLTAVLPFLGALTVPKIVFEYPTIKPFINFFGISTPDKLILPMTILFCVTAVTAGIWRLLILWCSTKYSYALGADFGLKIFKNILHQPYVKHQNENSGELISIITIKINHVVYSIIFQLLAMLVSFAIAISIIVALIIISIKVTIISILSFGLIYVVVFSFERRKLLEKSHLIAENATKIVEILSESKGNIKDIILDSSQETHSKKFSQTDIPMRNAQVYHQFIGQSPRYLIEALGIVIIAIIAYFQVMDSESGYNVIPILGTFALGAQRLLPAAQQIFAAVTNINGSSASMRDLLVFLDQDDAPDQNSISIKPLPFTKSIEFKNVDFSFETSKKNILQNISFKILAGEQIGIVGETGSGKSTVIDILMGLLEPTSGSLLVDDIKIDKANLKEWQQNICHVPQNIFLIDGTVKENITLSESSSEHDNKNLLTVTKVTHLAKALENFSKGLDTFVGERGARLSGGEIQRIGIARALYKNKNLIVFDEATSALDSFVETKVMNSINELPKNHTIVMVAHRVSSLSHCDKIIMVENGKTVIIEAGTKAFKNLLAVG